MAWVVRARARDSSEFESEKRNRRVRTLGHLSDSGGPDGREQHQQIDVEPATSEALDRSREAEGASGEAGSREGQSRQTVRQAEENFLRANRRAAGGRRPLGSRSAHGRWRDPAPKAAWHQIMASRVLFMATPAGELSAVELDFQPASLAGLPCETQVSFSESDRNSTTQSIRENSHDRPSLHAAS